MEEHGVSKIVSVKFHKSDETTTATAGAPLVKIDGVLETAIPN
jgi:hypothetical protein